ncbi:MAG: alpha-hydroxy-acid oxidizing protein [Clostridiaceae bacterium]
MDYKEVLENARNMMMPNCRVCNICNGIACKGEIPGVGAKGNGSSFTGCVEFLNSIKLRMDTIYKDQGQDTSITLFGKKFKYPVFIAPMGGIDKFNYNGAITEIQYYEYIVKGANNSGIAAFTGDGPDDRQFLGSLPFIKDYSESVVPTLKPWKNELAIQKIRQAEEVNAMAFAMDVDSAGLINLSIMGKPVSPKNVEELHEIAHSTKMPFIVKGIMTAAGAMKALEAGAYGIIVSTHGGRVIEDAPATCSMLPEIKTAVGNKLKIFVDGGIRSGADVFKAIALGADAVLIGRPYVIAAHGGGVEGVELYTEKIGSELKNTMLMTGCRNLSEITYDKIIYNRSRDN